MRLSFVWFVVAAAGCSASHAADASCPTCADGSADTACASTDAGTTTGWDSSFLDYGTRDCRPGNACSGLGVGDDAGCCPGQMCNAGACRACELLGSDLTSGLECCPGLERHPRPGTGDVCGLLCVFSATDGGVAAPCGDACGAAQYWRCDAVRGDICE